MWVRRGPCELSSILALSQLFEGTLQYMYKCCRPADLYFVINVTAGTTYNFVYRYTTARRTRTSLRSRPPRPTAEQDGSHQCPHCRSGGRWLGLSPRRCAPDRPRHDVALVGETVTARYSRELLNIASCSFSRAPLSVRLMAAAAAAMPRAVHARAPAYRRAARFMPTAASRSAALNATSL